MANYALHFSENVKREASASRLCILYIERYLKSA